MFSRFYNKCKLLILLILICNPAILFAQQLSISTAEFPPFKYIDKQTSKVVGFDTEIITQVFNAMGIDPKIVMLPFSRADSKTREGVYAAYYTFTKNAEREQHYYYSDPISSVQDVIFKLKNLPLMWDSYQDLAEYRLGFAKKYNYDAEFLEAINNKQGISAEHNELQLLKLLARKRVDMIVCEISVCSFLIKENINELGSIDYFNKPIGQNSPRPFFIAFSKKWPKAEKLRNDFNIALKAFAKRADNPRKAIIEKYGAVCSAQLFPECRE